MFLVLLNLVMPLRGSLSDLKLCEILGLHTCSFQTFGLFIWLSRTNTVICQQLHCEEHQELPNASVGKLVELFE